MQLKTALPGNLNSTRGVKLLWANQAWTLTYMTALQPWPKAWGHSGCPSSGVWHGCMLTRCSQARRWQQFASLVYRGHTPKFLFLPRRLWPQWFLCIHNSLQPLARICSSLETQVISDLLLKAQSHQAVIKNIQRYICGLYDPAGLSHLENRNIFCSLTSYWKVNPESIW